MTYFPDIPGGVGGGDGQLIFQWNRTDLSQFDSASPSYSAESAGDASTSLLSVVSKPERGNVIRVTPEPTADNLTALWLVTDPIEYVGTRRDLLIELEMDDWNPGTSVHYVGVAFLANDQVSDNVALLSLLSTAQSRCGILNNTNPPVLGTSFTTATHRAGMLRCQIRGDQPAASAPRVTAWQDHWFSSVDARTSAARTGSSSTARGNMNDMGSNTTLDAAFSSETLDRWGLVFITASTFNPVTADILDLRAYLV